MSNLESKCMYCGSTSYGSGCIFASHHMHVHTDDPTRCIYCGMMAYGSGCIFNPYTHVHIHGADVGQTIKETTRKTVELSYIIDRLLQPLNESEAYKLKLINNSGKLLRTPATPYEQNLVSPLSRTLHHLQKCMPIPLDTLAESLKLLSNSSTQEETIEQYTAKIQLQADASHIIKQLHTLITESNKALSTELIEEAIESALLDVIC